MYCSVDLAVEPAKLPTSGDFMETSSAQLSDIIMAEVKDSSVAASPTTAAAVEQKPDIIDVKPAQPVSELPKPNLSLPDNTFTIKVGQTKSSVCLSRHF